MEEGVGTFLRKGNPTESLCEMRPHFWDPLRIHCSLCFLQIFLLCESPPFNQKRWSAKFSFANFANETFWASVTILFFITCNAFFSDSYLMHKTRLHLAMQLKSVDWSDTSVWNVHKMWPYYTYLSVRQCGTNIWEILIFLPSSWRISFRLPFTVQLIIREFYDHSTVSDNNFKKFLNFFRISTAKRMPTSMIIVKVLTSSSEYF
jgi:hypothetical protein